jgi:hypothetical protein
MAPPQLIKAPANKTTPHSKNEAFSMTIAKNWLYWLIGVLVLIGGISIYMVTSYLISYERDLAIAAEAKKQTDQLVKEREAERKAREEENRRFEEFRAESARALLAITSQQAQLTRLASERQAAYSSKIQDIQNSNSTDSILANVRKYLDAEATKTADDKIAFSAASAKEFAALKLEVQELKADRDTQKKQAELERQKVSNLQVQVDDLLKKSIRDDQMIAADTKLIALQQDTINKYEKAAKKSKLRRALDFGKPIAIGLIVGVTTAQFAK